MEEEGRNGLYVAPDFRAFPRCPPRDFFRNDRIVRIGVTPRGRLFIRSFFLLRELISFVGDTKLTSCPILREMESRRLKARGCRSCSDHLNTRRIRDVMAKITVHRFIIVNNRPYGFLRESCIALNETERKREG